MLVMLHFRFYRKDTRRKRKRKKERGSRKRHSGVILEPKTETKLAHCPR